MPFLPVVHHEAVVIALAIIQGREIGFQVAADGLGLREIHGRTGYGSQFARRNQRLVGRQPALGVELEQMVGHIARVLPFQVEISVVRQIDDGLALAGGQQPQRQTMVVGPAVVGLDVQSAGVTGVTVGAVEAEDHAVAGFAGVPEAVGKTLLAGAAVQVVRAVVDGQRVFLVAQRETAFRDAVGVAAGHLAHAGTVCFVVFRIVIAQRHVGHAAFLVGDYHRHDAGAQVREDHLRAVGIDDAEQFDVFGVDHGLPRFHGRHRRFPLR